MRSIPYSDIEKGVAAIAGIDPTSLLAHEKVLLAEYISDATKYCWDYYPWSEFTKTEKRYFRDSFVPSTSYKAGDEVFYNGKYYRARVDNSDATIDISTVNWYEVGDIIGAPEWSQKGLYYKGAKVQLDGVMYICIDQPMSDIESHGEDPCSFDLNGIHVTDANYFEEIYNIFDRYIAYEQVGKDAIGTCLAITLEDPRYNDTKPLNWREDREGIYIFPNELSFNEVWVRYRLQAPVFTSESSNEELPRFLAQAIKTFAYKHWLIGDGQHEKAIQQDMYGMDLLVRELDKMDSHQERGQPYVIIKNPYRRLNAKQGYVAPITEDQIGNLVEGETSISIQVGTDVSAFNAVKRGYASMGMEVTAEVRGKNALKESTAEISTEIKLGKSMGLNVAVDAYPDVIGTRVKLGTPIAGRTKIIGYNAVKKANLKFLQGRIICNTFTKGYKLNAVYWSGWDFPPPIIVIGCVNVIVEKISPETSQVVASFAIGGTFVGRNSVIESQVTIGLAKSVTCNGRTAVVRENATISAGTILVTANGKNALQESSASIASEVICTALGRSSVVTASVSSAIAFGATSTGSNVVVRSQALPIPTSILTLINGRSSVVYGNASGLINLLVTTSVQGFEAVVIGFANSSLSITTNVSGQIAAIESSASIGLSVSVGSIQHTRIANRLVDIEMSIYLGTPKDIQIYDSSNLSTGGSRGNSFSSDPYIDLDDDEVNLKVYSNYYIATNKVFDNSLYSVIDTRDFHNQTFFSQNISSTWEQMWKIPNPNALVETPLENTVLINKTPVTRKISMATSSSSDSEVYLGMYPVHQDNYKDVAVNQYQGSGVSITPQVTAPLNSRQDYAIQMQLFTIEEAQYYDSNNVLQTGLKLTNFADQVFGSGSSYRITNTTSYWWGQSQSYSTPLGYEDFSSTAVPSISSVLNLLWNRTGYGRYYIIEDDQSLAGTGSFRSIRQWGNTQYASNHTCSFDAWADNNWEYGNWHDPSKTNDPWYNSQGAQNRSSMTPISSFPYTNDNSKGYLFNVIPAKLKNRFPLEFQNFTSTADIIGAPKFVEATKN